MNEPTQHTLGATCPFKSAPSSTTTHPSSTTHPISSSSNTTHPSSSTTHPSCSTTHPSCSTTHPSCSTTHPSSSTTHPSSSTTHVSTTKPPRAPGAKYKQAGSLPSSLPFPALPRTGDRRTHTIYTIYTIAVILSLFRSLLSQINGISVTESALCSPVTQSV
ncbi:hypothetical protein XELAEV_18031907mg [Xenopus laevis]|uniref:Uncharacterized protein n=1 Tax=Xenopus laevis TaxID=8355 RepID=A0A974CNP6_XENLA|nr:hypothetical protein XELAEV_18031907mg [Xenopus laevis]